MRNDRLDLLLASGDELEPILRDGLSGDALESAPKPKKAIRGDDAPDWLRTDADPNDLTLQRWGVVVPEGKTGDRLLETITPLIRLREAEQGAPIMTYRVPANMDAREAVAWKDEVYWSEDVDESERPLYLLLLGDANEVSLELQHSLANCALVGRAHFAHKNRQENLDAYAAYAEKVVHYAERDSSAISPDMLFHVARDGTSATQAAEARLLEPCLELAMKNRESGKLSVNDLLAMEAEGVDEFIAAAARDNPSVLLSISHGLGAPRYGWSSDEEQLRKQGALILGHNDVLDAERLASQPFLPGGLWFLLACFGAGTPSSSVYHTWLLDLAKEGAFTGKAKSVMASLPQNEGRPFFASLPQAALANAAGPLAVIGHMDLAWTYGFSSASNLNESRKSRFYSTLEIMARGSRAGVGLGALMRFYRETNDALMAGYQLEAEAKARGQTETIDGKGRGHLWMLRNDLRGYMLLGDPAARLPLKKNVVVSSKKKASAIPEIANSPALIESGISLTVKENAVLNLIQGEESPVVIARRAGVTLPQLFAWFDAYRSGGRARL